MSGTASTQRPRPDIDADSEGFWAALAEGRLVVPRCCACERRFFPPTSSCPLCGSTKIEQVEASGRGRVYSWVTVHMALDPAFAEDVPYTIVAVDLVEGGRIFGRLLEPQPVRLQGGEDLQLETYRDDDIVLPGFRRLPAARS